VAHDRAIGSGATSTSGRNRNTTEGVSGSRERCRPHQSDVIESEAVRSRLRNLAEKIAGGKFSERTRPPPG
jgi:hypothetical protein